MSPLHYYVIVKWWSRCFVNTSLSTQMVTMLQSYTKSSFFGVYFNQPSPLYLPIKIIEFISEVNPSRDVFDSGLSYVLRV